MQATFFLERSFYLGQIELIQSMPRQKRAGQHSLVHWWLVHSMLHGLADARTARAACLLRHITITSNYYIIIPVRGVALSRLGSDVGLQLIANAESVQSKPYRVLTPILPVNTKFEQKTG